MNNVNFKVWQPGSNKSLVSITCNILLVTFYKHFILVFTEFQNYTQTGNKFCVPLYVLSQQ